MDLLDALLHSVDGYVDLGSPGTADLRLYIIYLKMMTELMAIDQTRQIISLASTTLFEMMLKFDIGRYELSSSGLSVGFLSRGRTTACFSESGKTPSVSDALHIKAMVLAKIGRACFTSQVGSGSSAVFCRCLTNDLLDLGNGHGVKR